MLFVPGGILAEQQLIHQNTANQEKTIFQNTYIIRDVGGGL